MNKTNYRHIIYQDFQKKIVYNVNIFLALNKIHTTLDKSKSAPALLKSNKNHLKNQSDFKFIFLQFFYVGKHFTLISMYFIFGEK